MTSTQQKRISKGHILCAIICITFLEAIALLKGIDGILLTTIIGIIAGIIGWTMPQPKTFK